MNSHESAPFAINSGLLPNGWQVVSLRDAIEELKNGFASGKRDENGIVQIRMNNVTTDGRLIFDSYLKVPIPENISNWLLKKGDFLFNNTNSIDLVGKSTIFNEAPFHCTFSNHFTRLRFKKELVMPELILYHFLILWEKGYFKSVAIRHVGQSAVHTDYLLKLQIPLPPLPEQRRIAEVLGTVDSAIQKVGGAIAGTERLKKGLMQRLLTRGIGHERFKETEVGRVPEEWEVVRLGDAIEELKNGFASGKRDENGTVQIRMNNVTTDGRLIFESYLKVPVPENINYWLLKKGDFLFNNTNSIDLVGKSTIFNDAPFQCTFSNHFTRLRFKKELVLSELILYHFLILWEMGYFKSVAIRHVGQSAVHTEYLLKLQIPLPPLPEQRRIAEILSAADRKLELERRRKEKLERVKKGLMNELLTGRKRVKI